MFLLDLRVLMLSLLYSLGQGLLPVPSGLPVEEMKALQDIYFSTSGPDWILFGVPWNFTGAHNPCIEAWEGIKCTCKFVDSPTFPRYINNTIYAYPTYYYDDGSGINGASCHVTHLLMGMMNLAGNIPSSLKNLRFLTGLHMERNWLSGTIPSEIGLLPHLQQMMIFSNSLTGSLPTNIGLLSHLLVLGINSNRLSGPIPASLSFCSALQVLYLFDCHFTGPLPTYLTKFSDMTILHVNHNHLSGPIPDSIVALTKMEVLSFSDNKISGPLPSGIGAMPMLNYLSCWGTLVTGSIPTSFGDLSSMRHLDLDSNALTGYIPSTLGDLRDLQYLFLYSNFLSGPIPSTLGNCKSILFLYLYDNILTGSISSSIGALSMLQLLWLFSNHLTGSIPPSLARLTALQELLLYDNSLGGNLDNVFDPHHQLLLRLVDVNSNYITGSLPVAMFQMPSINTVGALQNCFTGTIPTEICSASTLQVLVLDGLHSALLCQDRFFPHNPAMPAYGLDPLKSVSGSLPSCLFDMPNITTLHVSGNGLRGTIPGGAQTMRLSISSLSLAHNVLTGTIPSWVQHQPWVDLNLGYNRFTGTLSSSLEINTSINTNFVLNVNRLSGNIPPSVQRARDVVVLGGNLFDCSVSRLSLPPHDPDYQSYQCGSNNVNFALVAWVIVFIFSFTAIPIVFVVAHNCQRNDGQDERGAVSGDKEMDRHHQQQQQQQQQCDDRENEAILKIMYENLALLWAILKPPSAGIFAQNLKAVRRLVLLVTGLGCCVLMPTYAALSSQFQTHSFLYMWVVSVSYISGSTAAGIVVTMWLLVGIIVCIAAAQYIPTNVTTWRDRVASATPSVTSAAPSVNNATASVASATASVAKWQMNVLMWGGIVLTNLVIMGALNTGYVVSVTYGVSQSAVTVLEILLGVIKGAWNCLVLPRAFGWVMECQHRMPRTTELPSAPASSAHIDQVARPPGAHVDQGGAAMASGSEWLVFHSLVICNNILLPCIVVALINPNCFYNVIVQANAIDASYSYSYCYTFGLFGSGCLETAEMFVSVSYPPPFIYSYQCASTLLTNYAAVYVYAMTFSSFVLPIVNWFYHGDQAAAQISPERFTIQLVNMFAILVTFGLVFPPLSVVVLVAVYLETYYAHAVMTKFMKIGEGETEAVRRALAVNMAGHVIMESLISSLWLLVPLAGTFNAFFVFDILGDDVGMRGALGGLLTVTIIWPLVMWGCYVTWRRVIVSRGGISVDDTEHSRTWYNDYSASSGAGSMPAHKSTSRKDVSIFSVELNQRFHSQSCNIPSVPSLMEEMDVELSLDRWATASNEVSETNIASNPITGDRRRVS